jgi:protoporphyrinogen IX oxidase
MYDFYLAAEAALEPYYELLRGLHIIAFIAWMAGLLYLPRLFVYHAERGTTPEIRETFKVMERRLLVYIMHPSLIVTWATGVALLIALPGWGPHLWMLIKIAAAVGLTGMHLLFTRQVGIFARDANRRSGRYYRIINEVPTVLMIVIVMMATLEPWDHVFAALRGAV